MAPMFILRASVSCPATDASCSSESDSSSGFDPYFMEKSGPHRYIGIAMVAGLILIIILVWAYRGRWPRKMLQQYCCCKGLEEPPEHTDDDTPPTQTAGRSGGHKRTPGDSELVKEVSAGMVVFTKVPKALRAKDRHHPVDWEMDPVNGIRLEVLILSHLLLLFFLLMFVLVRHELHPTMQGMAVDRANLSRILQVQVSCPPSNPATKPT